MFLVKGVKLQGIDHLVRHFLAAAAPRRRVAADLQACHLDDHAGRAAARLRRRRSSPSGRAQEPPLQDMFLTAAAREQRADDHVPGQRRDAAGPDRRLRPVLHAARARRPVQLVYKQPSRPCSRRIRSTSRPSRGDEEEASLSGFDGDGAIEVARGERAVIVVPELPREGARRSADARLDEAAGLAEAIGIDVVAANVRSGCAGPAGDPVRQGPGRGDRRARARPRTPSW